MQFFGMSAMYFSQRYAFKQSAIKVIESRIEQQFTVLKLTALEFQLAQFDEEELFINGQLFDIIDKKFDSGYAFVKVYRDIGEESLLKKTIDWFDSSGASHSSLPKLILKTFFNPIVLENSHTLCFYVYPLRSIYSNQHLISLSVFIKPAIPPPLSFC